VLLRGGPGVDPGVDRLLVYLELAMAFSLVLASRAFLRDALMPCFLVPSIAYPSLDARAAGRSMA
jgi:hypothetical protein